MVQPSYLQPGRPPQHLVLMGVAGSGKSTLGRALARALGRTFVEGDDHHPAVNLRRMKAGTALMDADRRDWISALCRAANGEAPTVITCSALSAPVQTWIEEGLDGSVRWVWLDVPEAALRRRLEVRSDHFFPPGLLGSQLAALRVRDDALRVDGRLPVGDQIALIRERMAL